MASTICNVFELLWETVKKDVEMDVQYCNLFALLGNKLGFESFIS